MSKNCTLMLVFVKEDSCYKITIQQGFKNGILSGDFQDNPIEICGSGQISVDGIGNIEIAKEAEAILRWYTEDCFCQTYLLAIVAVVMSILLLLLLILRWWTLPVKRGHFEVDESLSTDESLLNKSI